MAIFAMVDLKPFIVLGLAVGGLYAIAGVTLVVLYRTTGVINLAYGAIGALGALIAWELVNASGFGPWPAALVCVVFSGIVTLAYGAVFGRVFAARDPLVKAIGTLALALVLLGVMTMVWGQDVHSLPLPTDATTFTIGGAVVTLTQLLALGLALGVTGVVTVMLRVTALGTAMRALADDREISATLGIPVRRVEAAAWGSSGVLGGVSAVLLADLYGLDYASLTFLVISFLAPALIGRLRSLWVTFAAALVIGVVQSCMNSSATLQPYESAAPFVFAIGALLWLGRHRVITITGILRAAPGTLKPPRPLTRERLGMGAGALGAVLAALLFILPPLLSNYWIEIATATVIYSVVALGAGLLMGRVGLVSLCQIALLAVGGWVALRIGYATSLPFPLVILAGGVATAAIGLLIGLPALRLSGLYLALITLMAAGAVTTVLTQINFPNGGHGFDGYNSAVGATGTLRAPAIAQSHPTYFRYALIVAVLMFALAWWNVRGRPGRAWTAIRQSEPAALAAGVNVTIYKIWAFVLTSFITGVAGGLLAASGGGLTVYEFPTQNSLTLLAAVLMGGMYSFGGAIVAGVLMELLPALLQQIGISASWLLILFGIGAAQVLWTSPAGIVGQFGRDVARLRAAIARPRSRRAHEPELSSSVGEAKAPR